VERVDRLQADAKEWKRKARERGNARGGVTAVAAPAVDEELNGVRFSYTALEGDVNLLRQLGDSVKAAKDPQVGLFAANSGKKAALVAAVSKPAVERGLNAASILKAVNKAVGGGSGGRSDMAQAGGIDRSRLDEAVAAAQSAIRATLE
ncbi:DHHA1 domain-containing protein, partial [Planctomycetota bacterium]